MSGDTGRRCSGSGSRGLAVPAIVPPQVVSDRSILDSAIGFINEVTLAHQPHNDSKDTITWARFETVADISDPRFGEDWEVDGNVAPPLLLILGYGLGVQVWAIPANGEAVEVLSWRHGIVSALRVLPTPTYNINYYDDHGRADEQMDHFADRRPLIALVDGSSSAGAHPQFCAVNFVSLKTGQQVKTIKFKNPVLDVLANRASIVITFHERIAVFDALTFEDRLSITTCYPSPGINPNPVALGPRWLAYAEHKLIHSKRSGGGCDGDGVPSYTATVLNAAKSFSKGLRELGEQVAAGLTGSSGSGSISKNNSFDSNSGSDAKQPGIITILDIKNPIKDYSPTSGTPMSGQINSDPIIAHFIAHSEAIVACEFDNSGMILVTADRRGHDFHVFRIQPHPVGSSLAAVHHLYILHRGDTSAKVQNIAFSLDSRWVAISTLRGTTHVFPITPYGGAMGFRTHASLHVVNKLSRFHRSAGLTADGRSSSPISHSESTTFVQSLHPYHNPTLPPFPKSTVIQPLAQLRQPFALGSPPGTAGITGKTTGSSSSSSTQRQRLSSLSDDSGKPLSVCAIFAKSRSWLLDPPNATREAPHRIQRKAVDSLFVMAGHGALIQYDLDVKLASNVAKEKICDDTPIELEVEAKAQWNLVRRKDGSQEIIPPLSLDNWLIKNRSSCTLCDDANQHLDDCDDRSESWLSQVEIITHAGPHRRLWMGPQFVFKTYNTPSGSNLSHVDAEAVEIGVTKATSSTATHQRHVERSSPLNMPLTATGRSAVPVLIESGSYSSIEQSPKLMDRFRHDHMDSDYIHGDTRLKEDLADAMRESPSASSNTNTSGARFSGTALSTENIAFYDALTEHEIDDYQPHTNQISSAAAALANALPNIYSFDPNFKYESFDSLRKVKGSIEKIVNPLGTVTTINSGMTNEIKNDILDEVVLQLASEDTVIHENCDESLFRPVVAIFCDENERLRGEEEARRQKELATPPESIDSKLIVPVIAKEVDDVLSQKEKQKYKLKNQNQRGVYQERRIPKEEDSTNKNPSNMNEKTASGCAYQKQSSLPSNAAVAATVSSEKSENSSKGVISSGPPSPSGDGDLKNVLSIQKTAKKSTNLSANSSLTLTANVATSSKSNQKTNELNKLEDKNESTKEQEQDQEKDQEKEPSLSSIRTEQLNVTSLTDSLLELAEAEHEEPSKVITSDSKNPKPNQEAIKKNEEISKKSNESSKKSLETCKKNQESSKNSLEETPKSIESSKKPEDSSRKPLEQVKMSKAISKKPEENPKPSKEASKLRKESLEETKKSLKESSRKSSLEESKKNSSKVSEDDEPLKEHSSKSTKNIEKSQNSSKKSKENSRKSKENSPEMETKFEESNSSSLSLETKLSSLVDVSAAPKTQSKKSNKKSKKQTKSGSNSESEEIIEIDSSLKSSVDDAPSEKDQDFDTFHIEEKETRSKNPFLMDYEDKDSSVSQQMDARPSTSKENEFSSSKAFQEKKNDSCLDKDDRESSLFKGFEGPDTIVSSKVKTVKSQEFFKETKNSKNSSKQLKRNGSSTDSEEILQVISPKATEEKENSSPSLSQTRKSSLPLEVSGEGKDSEASIKNESSNEQNKVSENLEKVSKLPEKKAIPDDSSTNSNKESEIHKKEAAKDSPKNISSDFPNLPGVSGKPNKSENNLSDKESNKVLPPKPAKRESKSDSNLEIEEIVELPSKGKKKAQKLETKISKEPPSSKLLEPMIHFEKKPDSKLPKDSNETSKNPKDLFKKIDKKEISKASELKSSDVIIDVEDDEENLEKDSPKSVKKLEHPSKDLKSKSSLSFEEKCSKGNKEESLKNEKTENLTSSSLDKNDNAKIPSPGKKKTEDETNSTTENPSSKVKPSFNKSPKKSAENDLKDPKTDYQIKFIEGTAPIPASRKLDTSSSKVITRQPTKSPQTLPIESVKVNTPTATESPKKQLVAKTFKNSEKDLMKASKDVVDSKPFISAWKTMSGAEMIAKTIAPTSTKSSQNSATSEKLLPDLPTPLKPQKNFEEASWQDAAKSKENLPASPPISLANFPSLQTTIESLPPLSALEPLEDLSPNALKFSPTSLMEPAASLINFESPLQENPALERKITPPPRGFTEQNLIFALCGSLHYENETSAKVKEDFSQLLKASASLNLAKTQDDSSDNYSKNDKAISSSNSSASEDIIVADDRKLTKKQKRKRQQQLQLQLEIQKKKDEVLSRKDQEDDEELRPLIGELADSQYIDTMTASEHFGTPLENDNRSLPPLHNNLLIDDSFSLPTPMTGMTTGTTTSTTTDSEGPMPATTSDDNVCSIPSFTTTTTPNKIKTKKLDHKFNLIAAIEAATSSSTSSAEEEALDLIGTTGRSSDTDIFSNISATPLPINIPLSHSINLVSGKSGSPSLNSHHQQNALKKKTKRRFLFSSSAFECRDYDVTDFNKRNIERSNKILIPSPQQRFDKTLNVANIYQHTHSNQIINCNSNSNEPQSTIVNIDIFDDQLSTSSISTNSRFSLDPSSASPPISLNGLPIDSNFMHFHGSSSSKSIDDVRAGNSHSNPTNADIDDDADDGLGGSL